MKHLVFMTRFNHKNVVLGVRNVSFKGIFANVLNERSHWFPLVGFLLEKLKNIWQLTTKNFSKNCPFSQKLEYFHPTPFLPTFVFPSHSSLRTISSIFLVTQIGKHFIFWANFSNVSAFEKRCYWSVNGNVLLPIDCIPNFNNKCCNFP